MRRTPRFAVAFAFAALVGCGAGCGGSAHETTLSAGARRAQQNILEICKAPDAAAARAAGGGSAVEKDVEVLAAEARRLKDPGIARPAVAALRLGKRVTTCDPDYADRLELELLPQTPPRIVQSADVSSGLPIFRRGAVGYYRTHLASGEDAAESECVTTSAGLFEHESELENFLYLLSVGNAQAQQLLAHLRADCRAEGR